MNIKKKLIFAIIAFFITIPIINNLKTYANTYKITDENELNKYIIQNNTEIPEGYYLEKVKFDTDVNLEDLNVEDLNLEDLNIEDLKNNEDPNLKIFERVYNGKFKSSNHYFTNNPISYDIYDGPTVSTTYTFEEIVESKINGSFGASLSGISAELGFNVSTAKKYIKQIILEGLTDDQKLKVSVFGLYDKYSFDVYSLFGSYKGTGYAYKPMGIYIKQEIYSKK